VNKIKKWPTSVCFINGQNLPIQRIVVVFVRSCIRVIWIGDKLALKTRRITILFEQSLPNLNAVFGLSIARPISRVSKGVHQMQVIVSGPNIWESVVQDPLL
jgi:hypothetical protein